MNKVIKRFENLMIASLAMVCLNVIVGLVFILCKDFATKLNVIILGSFIIVHGLFYLIRYIYDGLGNKFFAIDLIIGVMDVILGVFTLINANYNILQVKPFELDLITSVGILFGVWLIIAFIEKVFYGIKFLKADEEIYPLICFMAGLLLIMGILVIINPFNRFMLITRLVGLFMICSGLFEAMSCMLFRRRAKNILDLFK